MSVPEGKAPLLSIVVPAYNVETYLGRALDPLIDVSEQIEVIVVDDGSTDGTAGIAVGYEELRPSLFRVIRQPNSGHGGALNTGIRHARGTYLKILDADDWLDVAALRTVLETLRRLEQAGGVDALFTDYVHDRVGKSNRTTRFGSVFPSGRRFGWAQTQRFGARQYLMMHAIVYRTALVKESGLTLPEHTFYVDNLYVSRPLMRVRTMYYLPVSLYYYFIGRADQSVAPEVMLASIDQQLRVTRLMLDRLPTPAQALLGEVPVQLQALLAHHAAALCAITSATLTRGGTAGHLRQRDAFWAGVRTEHPWLYRRMGRSLVYAGSRLHGRAGRQVTMIAYGVARRLVGFS